MERVRPKNENCSGKGQGEVAKDAASDGDPLARLRRHVGTAYDIVHETVERYFDDHGALMSAATAFYGLLALAPMIVFAVTAAGFVVGEDAARRVLNHELTFALGETGARAVTEVARRLEEQQLHSGFNLLGAGVTVYATSRLFVNVRDAMNQVWNVRTKPKEDLRGELGAVVRKRLYSLALVVGIGLLLMASVVVTALLNAATRLLPDVFPSGLLWQAADTLLSLTLITGAFGLAYRYLPDARVRWRDVWPGAVTTAVLFVTGKAALVWYLGGYGLASLEGSSASLFLVLLWAHYSASIFILGAELTEVIATRYGTGIRPQKHAVRVSLIPEPTARGEHQRRRLVPPRGAKARRSGAARRLTRHPAVAGAPPLRGAAGDAYNATPCQDLRWSDTTSRLEQLARRVHLSCIGKRTPMTTNSRRSERGFSEEDDIPTTAPPWTVWAYAILGIVVAVLFVAGFIIASP